MTHINGNGTSVAPQAAQPSPEVRVILADSQAIYRVGMRKVFGPDSGVLVVAEASRKRVVSYAKEGNTHGVS